jgi:hypothetical protein
MLLELDVNSITDLVLHPASLASHVGEALREIAISPPAKRDASALQDGSGGTALVASSAAGFALNAFMSASASFAAAAVSVSVAKAHMIEASSVSASTAETVYAAECASHAASMIADANFRASSASEAFSSAAAAFQGLSGLYSAMSSDGLNSTVLGSGADSRGSTVPRVASASVDLGFGPLSTLPELASKPDSGVIDAFLNGKSHELRREGACAVMPDGSRCRLDSCSYVSFCEYTSSAGVDRRLVLHVQGWLPAVDSHGLAVEALGECLVPQCLASGFRADLPVYSAE